MMYVLVLGATAVVATIGLAALLTTRIAGRSAAEAENFAAARTHARSAMQFALLVLQADTAWRTHYKAGTLLVETPIGNGTMSASIRDTDDGALEDDPADPIELSAVGRQGDAQFLLRLPARPKKLPIDALRMCVHGVGEVRVRSGATATVAGAPLSSNGLVRIEGAVTGNVEGGSLQGSPSGTSKVPAPTKAVPTSSAFDSYRSRATAIPYAATMSGFVLAPGYSSFGTPNAAGIYMVSTSGSTVTIQNARVYGTLIVLASGAGVTLQQNLLIEAPSADQPALLVDGSLDLSLNNSTRGLVESSLNVNFNPAGAPYAGVSDNDKLDYYTSGFRGLVHCTGSINLLSYTNFRGILLCNGQIDMRASADFTYDADLAAHPPAGYTQAGLLEITQGSWEQAIE